MEDFEILPREFFFHPTRMQVSACFPPSFHDALKQPGFFFIFCLSWHLKWVPVYEPPARCRDCVGVRDVHTLQVYVARLAPSLIAPPLTSYICNQQTQLEGVRHSCRAYHRSAGQASGALCRRTHHQVPPFNSARRMVDRVTRSNEARLARQSRVASKGQT